MKQMKWSPARMQMGLSKAVRPPLGKLVSKRTLDSTQVALDLAVGAMLSIGLYTIVSPRCIMPNTPVASHPEAALILGLLSSGVYWFATGENVTSMSGAVSTAFIYGLCKLGFTQ